MVLGAGASAGMGLPTLKNIFRVKHVQNYMETSAPELLSFLTYKIWSPRGISISTSDTSINIEEILTLLRQWGQAAEAPIDSNLIGKLKRQLLGCIPNAVYRGQGQSAEGRCLNKLIENVERGHEHVTWATFNWDVKLEQAFWYLNRSRNIPRDQRLPTCNSDLKDWEGHNERHSLMKLHGSVSWFQNPDSWVHSKRFGARPPTPIDTFWQQYLLGNDSFIPVIAEPSFFKHELIRQVPLLNKLWQEFDQKLAAADNILVCGYSLPDGDALAKQSFLSCVARNPTAKWTIVDPEATVLERYKRLLGRERTSTKQMTLDEFVATQSLFGATDC